MILPEIPLRVMVKDDRGRSVALFDEKAAQARDADAVPARQAAQAGYDPNWRRPLNTEEVWAGLLCGLLPLFAMIAWAKLIAPITWMYLPVAVGLGLLTAALSRRATRRAQAQRIVTSLLGAGRCASCGYALADLPREADGCTVCSECGAAWRLGGA